MELKDNFSYEKCLIQIWIDESNSLETNRFHWLKLYGDRSRKPLER